MRSKLGRVLLALMSVVLLPASLFVGVGPASAARADVVKYPWSDDLYDDASIPGTYYPTDYDDWLSLGSPSPRTVNWITGSELRRYATNTNEVFINGPGMYKKHHLNAAEFQATGQPASEIRYLSNAYYGYTWNDTVVRHLDLSRYEQLSYEGWTRDGQPTPEYRASYLGDRFCKVASTGAVYFSNPTRGINNAIHLTPAQYAGAGNPFLLTC